MSVLSFATQASAHRLYRSFFTPTRYNPTPAEQALLDQGTKTRLAFPGGNLTLTSWGANSAPAVLLMHGWAGSSAQMTGFVRSLLHGCFRVITYDQPAHGTSAGQTANILEIAQSMDLISEKFGAFEAVIAHSFGALVTTYSIVAGNFIAPAKLVYFGALNHIADILPRYQAAEHMPETMIHPLRRLIDRKLGPDVLRTINHDAMAQHLHSLGLMFHDRSDHITPVDDSRAIAKAWPQARYIETDGLGHHGALQSRKIHEQVISFLMC